MTAQLILLGTRRPGTDDAYKGYASVAGPLFMQAGAEWNCQFDRVADLVAGGPDEVRVMNFPDEETIRAVFDSDDYQRVAPLRDEAFERLEIIVATVPS